MTCDRAFSADCNMKPPYPPGPRIASRCRIVSTSVWSRTARSLIELSTALILGRRPFLPPLWRDLTLSAFAGFGGVLEQRDRAGGSEIAMDDENAKAWQLWRISPVDCSQIELVAEADTRHELRRLSKQNRRPDWRYKTYHNGLPVLRL